jgi:hypothetical protein
MNINAKIPNRKFVNVLVEFVVEFKNIKTPPHNLIKLVSFQG